MNKISENIIQLSFRDELEKQAFLKTVVKVLKNADLVAGVKGIRKGVATIAEHKGPMFDLPKGALKNPVKVKTYGKDVGFGQKFILSDVLGDTAHALHKVTEGVGKGKSITKNVGTLIKNVGSLLAGQIRGAKYKVIPKDKAVLTGSRSWKNLYKRTEIKGKGLLKGKRFNRPIAGRTTSGDYIVKKRKATVPFSMALTPVGFGAGTFLLGSGKEKETMGSRTRAGLQETALWALAPPVAQAKLISDMLK